ncbi:MAG: 50S ribosomal protein L10, partial [Armatimonadetes bacterium]|nr:50S ribosomal protein L10 [Armatimonadota bacterium]
MRKAQKEETVARFQGMLEGSRHLIVSDYRGLDVKAMIQLRRAITAAGGELRVVKKSLFRHALGEGESAGLVEYMEGPVAVTFVAGDPDAVLKEMQAFGRTHPQLEFKGGWVEAELLDGQQVGELASLPPRQILLAQLLSGLSGP